MFAIVNEADIWTALRELALGWAKVTWVTFGLILVLVAYVGWATHKLNCRLRVLEARLLEKEKFSTS